MRDEAADVRTERTRGRTHERTLAESIAALLLAAVAGKAHGVDLVPAEDADSPWEIGIALGYGERSNPLVQSDDIPIVVDVDIAWFGDRWFFDNGDGGLTVLDSDRVTLNVVGRFNSDRFFFGRTDTDYVSVFNLTGGTGLVGEGTGREDFGSEDVAGGAVEETIEELVVPDRDYAIEAGVELLTDGPWGFLQVGAFHDVSDKHEGYELDVSYGRRFLKRRWIVEPSIGFAFKSDRLNDYYWGVREDEANTAFEPYRAGSGVNARVRLAAGFQLTRTWAFSLAGEYERLSDEIALSPIVATRDLRAAYAGFHFSF